MFSTDFLAALEEELGKRSAEPSKSNNSTSPRSDETLNTLYRSNQMPSLAQTHVVNALLAEQLAAIADVDCDVLRLQLQINRLTEEMKGALDLRSQRQDVADSYSTLVAPVRLLPLEILTGIFEFSLPNNGRYLSSLIRLTHVCWVWRETALASSSLWSRLFIDVVSRSKPAVLSSMISSWFGRASRTHPLTFSVKHLLPRVGVPEAIVQSITPLMGRFAELRFENTDLNCLTTFLGLPGGSMPMLETLVLNASHRAFSSVITVFDTAPRLRTATLDIPQEILTDGSRFVFPWAQLTSLTLPREITISAFSEIIFKCIHLRSVSFCIACYRPVTPVIPLTPVTFAHLQTLKIRLVAAERDVRFRDLLSVLHLPAIRTLKLAGDIRGCPFPLKYILPGIADSLGLITTLFLSYVHTTTIELFELIVACPFLETLALRTTGPPQLSVLKLLRHGVPTEGTPAKTKLRLSYLTSFTFGLFAVKIAEPVVTEFIALIREWADDTSRKRRLETVSLCIYKCDNKEAVRRANAAANSIQHYLNPWTRTEEDRPGFVLNVAVRDMAHEV